MNTTETAQTSATTWTTAEGRTVVAHFPAADIHAVYASDTHTATVSQLAVAPASMPEVSTTGVTNGVAALILGGLIWYAVKHKGHKWGWMFVGVAMGTFIGAGSFGVMIQGTVGQLLASAINSLGGMA